MPNATPADVSAWLTNRLPDEWRATEAPEITGRPRGDRGAAQVAAPEVADQSMRRLPSTVAWPGSATRRATGASRSRSRPRACSSARCRGSSCGDRVDVHPPGGAGDGAATSARAAGARHAGRGRCGALPIRRAGVVCGWSASTPAIGSISCAPRYKTSTRVRAQGPDAGKAVHSAKS